MAQTVHLKLQIDGNDIEGESTVSSLEREDTIECLSFDYMLTVPYDATGRFTGRRRHEPVVFHKRVDKSTPLLLKALCRNEPVNSAEFMFFRPSPGGSGAEERFFTVRLEHGYITSVKQVSEHAIIGGEADPPMMEKVEFVFKTITWTYESTGGTHRDSWISK